MSPRAAEQAAWLRNERGITDVPLLLDPGQDLRSRVGLGKLGLGGVLSLRGALNYVRALRGGARQGRIHGYDLQPGVIVADATLDVVEVWRGQTYGDYPPVDEVISLLESRS